MKKETKTKKVLRLVALLTALVLCLPACRNASSTSTEDLGSTQSGANKTTESAEPEEKNYWELLDQVSDTSELPDWDGDILEISIWFASDTSTNLGSIPETDVVAKEIERVTGVKFNVEDSFDNGGNNIDAKLPMVVGSGDLPTVVVGHTIVKQLQELLENGYLEDLTEYLTDGSLDQMTRLVPLEEGSIIYDAGKNEDGSYFLLPQANLSSLANFYNMTGYDPGELYDATYYSKYGTTPKHMGGKNTQFSILVHNDILEAIYPGINTSEDLKQIYIEKGSFTEEEIFDVNIDTTEEAVEFFYKVKDLIDTGNYVGNDGAPMEVMAGPHSDTDNWAWMQCLPALMYGARSGTDYFSIANYITEDESKLMQAAVKTDYYIDFMKLLNQLVNDDVISKNSLLDNAASFDEKAKNNHYAIYYGAQFITYNKVNNIDDYRPVWFDVPMQEEYGGFNAYNHTMYMGIFKDTLNDEQLDQLIHAINYMNSAVGGKNFWWGPASAGLFTEDAEGNRTLNTEKVPARDSKEAFSYGLEGVYADEQIFRVNSFSLSCCLLDPAYLAKGSATRDENVAWNDVYKVFNPGTIPGKSESENAYYMNVNSQVYSTFGLTVPGNAQFWAARNGYENQVKKVIAADSEEEFEKQYQRLLVFAEENGLTDSTIQEFNDAFVETNRDKLQALGMID